MDLKYVDHCGSDLSVVNAARVSFAKHHDTFQEKDKGLINFLSREKHLSPFNHSYLTCHVKAPIFVARQLVKHKFMPWNEVSRRYVDDPPEFYTPPNNEWWAKASDKKQGRANKPVDYGTIQDYLDTCLYQYKDMLQEGVAPEQARMVLPLNTYTEWYWSGTFGAWMDMYNLRSKSDTQEETRTIALMAGEILQTYWPYSFEARSWHNNE